MAVRYIGTSISGIASDTKPTPSANEMGVVFVETDTNKLYIRDDNSWDEVSPSTILVTDNESTSENNLISFVANAATATGQQSLEMDGDFHYNPGTGTVTATAFVGNVTGATSGAVTASSIALNGNITTAAARTWTLMDNDDEALSFDASGKTGMLVFDTRNGAERITMSGDLTVAGTLTVATTTTVSSTTINVADPLIALATTNTANSVDIGFYGRYRTNGTNLYTGLVWDAGASKYILFHGNQAAPTTTVNTSGTGHTTSTLIANLEGNITGNAATVTVIDSTDTSSFIAMFDSATGSLAAKTDAGLTYNAGTGILTATGFTGTLQTAAQTNITSLGAQAANLNMNSNSVYNVTQLSGSHADGPRVAGDEASSATNPTFIVDRQTMTTGIGGTGTYVSSIVAGTERIRATTTGATITGTLTASTVNTASGDLTLTPANQVIMNPTSSASYPLALVDIIPTYNAVSGSATGIRLNPTFTDNNADVQFGTHIKYTYADTGTNQTQPSARAVWLEDSAVTGSGNVVTSMVGLWIDNFNSGASGSGTSLYIEGGGTYALHVDSGDSRFDGNISVQSGRVVTSSTGTSSQVLIGASGTYNAVINSPESVYINIDSDNGQTDREFTISHNGATDGSTKLFTVNESAVATLYGTAGSGADTALIFDGEAVDYHIGLRDSTDHLVIGKESTLGTTSLMTFEPTEGRISVGNDGDAGFDLQPAASVGFKGRWDFGDVTSDGHYGGQFYAYGSQEGGHASGTINGMQLGAVVAADSTHNWTSTGWPGMTALYTYISTESSGSGVVVNAADIYVSTGATSGATIATKFGIWIADQTVGTGANYGLYLSGASTRAIYVAADGITVAGGGINVTGNSYFNGDDMYDVGNTASEWTSGALLVHSAAANSHAKLELNMIAGGSGDAIVRFQEGGTSRFVMGIDDNNSEVFSISNGGDVGTNNRIEITAAGVVSIPGGVDRVRAAADSTNADQYVAFLDNASTTGQAVLYNTALTFNPVTGGLKTTGYISVASSKGIYLDGGGDTYIRESGNFNEINFYCGGAIDFTMQNDGDFHARQDIYAYSTTITSDIALKKNITVIDKPLDKVSQLRGVLFDWKDEKVGSSAGLIAQDVEEVLPELVKTVDDPFDKGNYKALNYNGIIGLLVESIKELKEEITELKNGSDR